MTADPAKTQFGTMLDTLKNFTSSSGVISVPSQSYSALQYRTFTTTIALDKTLASTLILHNFSFDSSNYWIGSFVQVNPDANFIAQTRCSVSGSTLSVTLYVVNATGGTASNPAFTLNTEVRRFVTPFS